MSKAYRLYRQDVIATLDNGDIVFNEGVIDGDCPDSTQKVTMVELDGTETAMVVLGYRLILRAAESD